MTAPIELAVQNMSLKSPDSPTIRALQSNVNRKATVFLSHVRRSFSRAPTDYTGELVRLLDDLATVTHGIAKYVSEGSESVQYGRINHGSQLLDPTVATRRMYQSLCHDGYACIILDKNTDAPLSLPRDALHGGYVVMLSALDVSEMSYDQPTCGTIFSVYRKRSLPSLPGRLADIQQCLSDQVAAGYVVYSSATTLFYTLGQGVFSFCLHPVAVQYFLQPSAALQFPLTNSYDIYTDYDSLRADSDLGCAVRATVEAGGGKIFDNNCFLADFHGALSSGGCAIRSGAHLLCEAGPLAFLAEQLGGKATNGNGMRILDMAIKDENVHANTTFCAGPAATIDAIEAKRAGATH